MAPYTSSDVWNSFWADAVREYGEEAVMRVSGREQLRQQLEHWLGNAGVALDSKEQVDDLAGDFLAHHRYDFERDSTKQPHRVVVRGGGSLARVAAYAEALPAVLQARQEVLGAREPLPYPKAVEWLVQETQDADGCAMVELSFRFLVPKASPALWRLADSLPGVDLLTALDAAALHTRFAPGAKRPAERPTETSLVMSMELDDQSIVVDLYRGSSDRLATLLSWAHRLSGRCVAGGASADAPDHADAVKAAILLILAGIWPRASVSAVAYHRRGWSLTPSRGLPRPQAPYVLMRVEAIETPPVVVAEAYKGLRRAAELNKSRRPLEPESEVLCMAALDAEAISGTRRGTDGYLNAVLQRYRQKAGDHNVDPEAFSDTPDGRDKARKALGRARTAYEKLYPGQVSILL